MLKKVFSLALLCEAQYRVNKVPIRTINKIRFPEQPFGQRDFVVRRDEYPFQTYSVASRHHVYQSKIRSRLFRGGRPMGLLKIYPPATYFLFHYMLLANQLGYQYDGQIGWSGTARFSGGFQVDAAELHQRITALLQR